MLDWIILFALMLFWMYVAVFHLEPHLPPDPAEREKMVGIIYAVPTIFMWLYFIVLTASPWSATLGKKLLRLRVVDLNGDGIGIFRSLFRYIALCIVPGIMAFIIYLFLIPFYFLAVATGSWLIGIPLVLILPLIGVSGFLMAAFTDQKRAIHDFAVGTLVVRD